MASFSRSSFQIGRALLCIGAAGVFWLLNALNKPGYSTVIQYPIQFAYDTAHYVPLRPLPEAIPIIASGNGWSLLRYQWLPFRAEPFRYAIDHPNPDALLDITALKLALSEHVHPLLVNQVVADTLHLSFDKRQTKAITLAIDPKKINLAPGYAVSSVINITPNRITLSGPLRLVRGLPDTVWLAMPRRQVVDNFDEELPINQFQHPLLHASATQAEVSFEVGQLLSPPTQPE